MRVECILCVENETGKEDGGAFRAAEATPTSQCIGPGCASAWSAMRARTLEGQLGQEQCQQLVGA